MNAPDKIYLHPDDRHWWHEGNKTDDRFVEYIRKDVLMEILQGYSHPLTKLVMQEIIDKINSL